MKKKLQKKLQINTFLYGLILLLFALTNTTANAQRLGVNSSDPKHSRVFVDLVKAGDAFSEIGKWAGFPIATDTIGWPTEDFMYKADLNISAGDPEEYQYDLSGTYKVSFNGKADIRVGGHIGTNRTVTEVFYNSSNNLTTFDFDIIAGTHFNLIYINFRNTQRMASSALNTGITNLKIIRPGYDRNTTQLFTDEWIKFIQPFKTIRYMDWLESGGNARFSPGAHPHDQVDKKFIPLSSVMPIEVDWNGRNNKITNATIVHGVSKLVWYKPSGEPYKLVPIVDVKRRAAVPWEYIIQFSNQTNTDPWINIPIHASDEYIMNLALLFKQGLNSNLTPYLEYSNEVWNNLFSYVQTDWNYRKATLEVEAGDPFSYRTFGGDNHNLWATLRFAKRTVEIGQIFKTHFGSKARVNLSAMRSGTADELEGLEKMLSYIASRYGTVSNVIDSYAGNGYTSAADFVALPPGASVNQVLDALEKGFPTDYKDFESLTNSYGINFHMYEGAPGHVVGFSKNIGNRILAARTPRMGEFIEKHIVDIFYENGGDLFMYLGGISPYTKSGTWGLTDDVANPFRNHKYQAILNILAGTTDKHPVISENSPLSEYALVNVDYSHQIEVSSGDAPLTWSLVSGSLPAGLSLSSSGEITGNTTQKGAFSFTIKVTDANNDIDQKEIILQVFDPVQIPFTTSSPTIDGTAETTFWSATPENKLEKTISGATVPTSNDLSANYKTAWDANNLYFFVSVKDDVIKSDSGNQHWNDDTIEIYLDINADRKGAYGDDDYQIIFPMGGKDIVTPNKTLGSIQRSQKPVTGGYVLEVAIPWGSLGATSPINGTKIGIDVHITDDDDGGARDSKITWNTTINDSWKNPRFFGLGILTIDRANPDTLTHLLLDNQWHQISLPMNPGSNNTVADIFGDDGLGTYGTDWDLYSYNPSTNSYDQPGITDILSQGVGYWIIQMSGDDKILKMPTGSTETPTTTPTGCPANKDCFEIPLATEAGADQWNMVGYPFAVSGLLSNSRIVATTNNCTSGCEIEDAEIDDVFQNQLWTYNGAEYVEVTTTIGTLDPWLGYWAATLNNASTNNPSLLFSK